MVLLREATFPALLLSPCRAALIVRACHREREDGSGLYELIQKLTFNGAVEGMTFARDDGDTFLVGSRSCHLLQCFDLISGAPVKVCMVGQICFFYTHCTLRAEQITIVAIACLQVSFQ